MEQIRFGILGAAAIAPNALIKPARLRDGVTVTAVAARDVSRANQFAAKHGIGRVLASYDELIADPDIDAIYIPLPNGLHGEWTIRAIEAGKHVLCEKPFTANADEARLVAAAASKSDVIVMEAFHWRYHPMATRLIEIVRDEIGDLEHIEATIAFPLFNRKDIRYDLGLSGGAVMDAGCYAINIVRAVTGQEPDVVSATAKLTSPGVDRLTTAELRFPSGATGRIVASMFSSRVLSISMRARGTTGDVRAFNPVMPKLLGSMRVRRGGERHTERPPRSDTYGHQLDAFVAAVRDGQPFPSTVADAVLNMEVIDSMYRAAGLQLRQPTNGPVDQSHGGTA